jgi:hypothetical protein
VTDTPEARIGPFVTVKNDVGYFFGGVNFFYETYGDLWKLDATKLGSVPGVVMTTTTTDVGMTQSSEKGGNSGTIAVAVVVPIVIVAIAAGVIGFLFIKRRR